MGEFEDYMKKVNDKVISSKALFDIGQYATSVSASYYAMFLTAKALLIKEGFRPKSHAGTISLFSEEYVLKKGFNKDIFKFLSRTQSLREEADYDSIDNITKKIAKEKIIETEDFINEAKQFFE